MKINIVPVTPDSVSDFALLYMRYTTGFIQKERSLAMTELDDWIGKCRDWIEERLASADGVFFLARGGCQVVGIAVLYLGFSPIELKKHWMLNDLFVLAEYRNQGVGSKLIERVHQYAMQTNAESVQLETAKANTRAQQLYQRMGYKEEARYKRYYWIPPETK